MKTQQTGLASDVINVVRGLLMGGADIIPGVSGGTVALILGIYERLVTAISHFDPTLLGLIRQRQWSAAASHIDLRFLLTLGMGIGLGIVSLAGLMHYLLLEHHRMTLAAFFGLIAASSWLVAKLVKVWRVQEILCLLGGAVFAYWLVGLPVFQQPPAGLPYIFFCGVIAICAMILPGISGAFILLLLGKYAEITGLIKGLTHGEINAQILLTILVFVAGCAVGLIGFSKLLKILLARYESVTMALLGGFMVGSLRKLWPFQQDLTPGLTELKHKAYENIPLQAVPTAELWPVLLMAAGAALAVLLLDRWASVSNRAHSMEEAMSQQS